ncbi:diguanylate cyclase [Enterobacter kobei]
MKFPGLPHNEEERLQSLSQSNMLDVRSNEQFQRLTRVTKKLFQAPVVLISLLGRDRQWFLACEGVAERETSRDISFCAHAILQQGPFIVNDASLDDRFHDNPLVTGSPYIRFYAGYPVHLPDGHVGGSLCIIDRKPREFSEADIEMLKDMAFIVEDEFKLTDMAMKDSLTGLPNRRGFYLQAERCLTEAGKRQAGASLIFFDLDKFKSINDLWGHAEGDNVLKAFSALLLVPLGEGGIAARLSGDEFVVLLGNTPDAATYLTMLQDEVDNHNRQADKPYNINYSYGVQLLDLAKPVSLEEMLAKSDSVMYSQKRKKTLP